MTDIYATVTCPAEQIATARQIGGDQWSFNRELTTNIVGSPPATHYGCSGTADAGLLALIVSLPGVQVSYDAEVSPTDALTASGLRFVVEDI